MHSFSVHLDTQTMKIYYSQSHLRLRVNPSAIQRRTTWVPFKDNEIESRQSTKNCNKNGEDRGEQISHRPRIERDLDDDTTQSKAEKYCP